MSGCRASVVNIFTTDFVCCASQKITMKSQHLSGLFHLHFVIHYAYNCLAFCRHLLSINYTKLTFRYTSSAVKYSLYFNDDVYSGVTIERILLQFIYRVL